MNFSTVKRSKFWANFWVKVCLVIWCFEQRALTQPAVASPAEWDWLCQFFPEIQWFQFQPLPAAQLLLGIVLCCLPLTSLLLEKAIFFTDVLVGIVTVRVGSYRSMSVLCAATQKKTKSAH